MLLIDNREDIRIQKKFKRAKVEFEVVQLSIGDYLCKEKGIVFERKSITDFIQSFRKGHLQKQLLQMEQFPHKYLMIVGNYKDVFRFNKYIHCTIKQWRGMIASINVRYNVKTILCLDENDMVSIINSICEKTNDGKTITLSDTELLESSMTISDMKERLIRCFKRVGKVRAQKILQDEETNNKLNSLICLMEEKWSILSCGLETKK